MTPLMVLSWRMSPICWNRARRAAARSVNSIMTATYWAVGRRIVEEEQRGKKRADYGEQLVTRLAKDLTVRYGRGFGHRNLYQMRQFYMAYPTNFADASAKSSRASHPENDQPRW